MASDNDNNRSLDEELGLGGFKFDEYLKLRGETYEVWRQRRMDRLMALTVLAIFFTLVGTVLLLDLRGPRVLEPGVHQGVHEGVPRDGQQD